jgi:hypothetical protein
MSPVTNQEPLLVATQPEVQNESPSLSVNSEYERQQLQASQSRGLVNCLDTIFIDSTLRSLPALKYSDLDSQGNPQRVSFFNLYGVENEIESKFRISTSNAPWVQEYISKLPEEIKNRLENFNGYVVGSTKEGSDKLFFIDSNGSLLFGASYQSSGQDRGVAIEI